MAFTYRTVGYTVAAVTLLYLAGLVSPYVAAVFSDSVSVTVVGDDGYGDTGVMDAHGNLLYITGHTDYKPGTVITVAAGVLHSYDD